MNVADMMRAMRAAGCTAEQMTAAVEFLDEERRARSREGNVERQRACRARKVAVTPVTPCHALLAVTGRDERDSHASHAVTDGDLARVEDSSIPSDSTGKEKKDIPPVSPNGLTSPEGLFGSVELERQKKNLDRLRAFAENWNELAADLKLPQIDEIKSGSTRERHALARLRENPDTDWLWPAIRGSPLLRGEVNGFRCTFDWVVKDSNFTKIKDGNYEARREKPKEINFLSERRH